MPLAEHRCSHEDSAGITGITHSTSVNRTCSRPLRLGLAALAGAGLAEDRFVFHSLRHCCASSLLAEGAPLAAVAGHLGDTVETVSRTYVHWLRDDREVPAAVLDRVLAPAECAPDVHQRLQAGRPADV